MTTEVRLCLKHEEFTALHQAAEGRKTTVSVNKEALERLLIDHSVMTKAIKSNSSFKLVEPLPKRERVRLTKGG